MRKFQSCCKSSLPCIIALLTLVQAPTCLRAGPMSDLSLKDLTSLATAPFSSPGGPVAIPPLRMDQANQQWFWFGSAPVTTRGLELVSVSDSLLSSIPSSSNATASSPAPLSSHKLEVHDPSLAAQIIAQGGRLVPTYDSFQLYEVPQPTPELFSQAGVENRDEYNLIMLNAASLDTSKPETQALRQPVPDFQGKRMHLVQFAGAVQPAWNDELLAAGVQIVTYLPQNAYLVYGDASSIARLQQQAAAAPHVQWDGAYLDSYKIYPRLVDENGNSPAEFAIQFVADPEANAVSLQLLDQLKLAPFAKQHPVLNYLNVVLRIAPENLALIAARPDVVSIHPYWPRQKFDERQDQIIAGNMTGNLPSGPGYLAWLASKGFTQAQFTASGFAADITDSGLDNGTTSPNHPGLHLGGAAGNASRVVYTRLEGTPNPGSTLRGC